MELPEGPLAGGLKDDEEDDHDDGDNMRGGEQGPDFWQLAGLSREHSTMIHSA